jgi:hypothetical protein
MSRTIPSRAYRIEQLDWFLSYCSVVGRRDSRLSLFLGGYKKPHVVALVTHYRIINSTLLYFILDISIYAFLIRDHLSLPFCLSASNGDLARA